MQRLHRLAMFLPVADNVGISCTHKPLPLSGPCLSKIHLQYDTNRKKYPPARKTQVEIRIESDLFALFPYFKKCDGIVDIVLPWTNTVEIFTGLALKTDATPPMSGIPVENHLSPAFTTLQQLLPSFFKKHCLYRVWT